MESGVPRVLMAPETTIRTISPILNLSMDPIYQLIIYIKGQGQSPYTRLYLLLAMFMVYMLKH
jgi:hypothetical protein